MSTFVIARLTFMEASRRKILLAALLLGLVFLSVYGVGFHYMRTDMQSARAMPPSQMLLREISNFMLTAGLYVVNFLTVMMTVLTSVDTVSGEIASGTIHTLASKPVRRWELVLGKWLGFAVMISLYLLLMAGGVIGIVYLLSGYTPNHPLQAVALMWINALVMLSVSLLGGIYFSTLANGVLVFGLYGISFIGGWIEQIGTFLSDPGTRHAAVNIGVVTSLIMPSEALWRRAAYEVQSSLVASFGFSPFASNSVPSTAMIVYAIIYLVAVFGVAVSKFNKRDL